MPGRVGIIEGVLGGHGYGFRFVSALGAKLHQVHCKSAGKSRAAWKKGFESEQV